MPPIVCASCPSRVCVTLAVVLRHRQTEGSREGKRSSALQLRALRIAESVGGRAIFAATSESHR
jgi:hypothetical protein